MSSGRETAGRFVGRPQKNRALVRWWRGRKCCFDEVEHKQLFNHRRQTSAETGTRSALPNGAFWWVPRCLVGMTSLLLRAGQSAGGEGKTRLSSLRVRFVNNGNSAPTNDGDGDGDGDGGVGRPECLKVGETQPMESVS